MLQPKLKFGRTAVQSARDGLVGPSAVGSDRRGCTRSRRRATHGAGTVVDRARIQDRQSLGDRTVTMMPMAARLDTLAGKTVCMVWNNAFKSDVTLPVIGKR
jgi:hypothetical protein